MTGGEYDGSERGEGGYGDEEGYSGDSQETFGAERLALNDNEEGGYGRSRREGYGGGYGENEYEKGY